MPACGSDVGANTRRRVFIANPQLVKKILGVTQRTLSNWNRHGVPLHSLYLIELIEGINTDWPRLALRPGYFITNTGYKIKFSEIEQIPWVHQQLHYSLQREKHYRAKLEALQKVARSGNSAEFTQSLQDILNSTK